jgi:hypothetical protein
MISQRKRVWSFEINQHRDSWRQKDSTVRQTNIVAAKSPLLSHSRPLSTRHRDHITWFWRCLGTVFEHIPLCSHNNMVTALGSCVKWPLWATSYTRLKTCDRCILRSLISRKGWDRPSSLHIRTWRRKDPKQLSWMKSPYGFFHNIL